MSDRNTNIMLPQGGPDPGGTTPEQRVIYRSFVAGAVVFAVLAVLLYLTFKSQTGLPFTPKTLVKVSFGNVHSLRVNDDVRESSRRVGRVSDESITGNDALITLEIDGTRPVYGNATAQIWDVSALATKFVEFDPGTADAGLLGDRVVPAKVDTDSSDLNQVLNIFDPVTRDATQTTLRQLGGGFVGHGPDFHDALTAAPDLLKNLGTVSVDLASPEFDMPDVLRSGDQLSTSLHGREAQIAQLEQQVDQTMQALSVDGGRPLDATLAKAPGTLSAVRPALDSLDGPLADTQTTMSNLQSGAKGLGDATPDGRAFLRDSIPVAGQVPDVADEAKPQVEDLTDTVSDARPVVPRVTDALEYLATPLQVLRPYAPELAQMIVRLNSFVSEGPEPNKRFARLNVNVDADTVTGGVVGSGKNYRQDVYAPPGQTAKDQMNGVFPDAIGVGGGDHK
jgi:phospholipid/cholesterol/gamma-HCH transport system substrate-binding protein